MFSIISFSTVYKLAPVYFNRRIVGAYLQVIAYEQYLPAIIGTDLQSVYGLSTESRTSYDSSVDPSIFNGFAAGAFRFGHSQIYDKFMMANHITAELTNEAPLDKHFFNADKFYNHAPIALRRVSLSYTYLACEISI